MMDIFVKRVIDYQPWTIFAKISAIDAWRGPKYASAMGLLYLAFLERLFSNFKDILIFLTEDMRLADTS